MARGRPSLAHCPSRRKSSRPPLLLSVPVVSSDSDSDLSSSSLEDRPMPTVVKGTKGDEPRGDSGKCGTSAVCCQRCWVALWFLWWQLLYWRLKRVPGKEGAWRRVCEGWGRRAGLTRGRATPSSHSSSETPWSASLSTSRATKGHRS